MKKRLQIRVHRNSHRLIISMGRNVLYYSHHSTKQMLNNQNLHNMTTSNSKRGFSARIKAVGTNMVKNAINPSTLVYTIGGCIVACAKVVESFYPDTVVLDNKIITATGLLLALYAVFFTKQSV